MLHSNTPATPFYKRQRFVVTVFFFISGIIAATWSSRIPSVQQKFAYNDAEWGSILFASPLGLMGGIIVSGWLIERFGTRFIMVFTGILYTISLLLIAVAQNTMQLVLALFLFGVFRNFFNMANNTHSIEVQTIAQKPIVARLHGIWSVSCIVAAGIGTVMLANEISVTIHFLVIVLACLLLIFLYFNYGSRANKRPGTRPPLFVKPDASLLTMGAITFCTMLCEGAMFDWSVNYFQQVVRPAPGLVTLGYTCFIVTMALGRIFGDKLINRFGTINLLKADGLLMAAGFLLAAAFPALLPASLAFLIIGAADAIIIPLIYSLAGKSTRMPAAYAISSVTFIGYFGFLIGPPVIGFISHTWNMRWAFVLLALLSIAIWALALQLRKML